MSPPTTRLEMTLRAEPSSVREAREAVVEAASDLGLSGDLVDDVRLCVSEVVGNVVRHAYVDAVGDLEVSFDRLGHGALVVVRDFGVGTTMRRAPHRSNGGFGWKIVESLCDRCAVMSTPEDGTEVWMAFGTLSRRPARRRSARSAAARSLATPEGTR
jgi:anti-sigma regulatory factor (Ser/Thr protein kinase)